MNLAVRLWAWFLSLIRGHPRRGEDLLYTTRTSTDEPDQLEPLVVYLTGENEHLWHATFLCPCSCGEVIRLNLLTDDEPCWSVHLSRRGVSFKPSIWRTTGCRSHFFLQSGRILWCHSDGSLSLTK